MKRILNYFRPNAAQNTASMAKERLQIIIAHERGQNNRENFLANLQEELLAVIAKYLKIDTAKVGEQIKFDIAHRGEHSVMELNITIPDQDTI